LKIILASPNGEGIFVDDEDYEYINQFVWHISGGYAVVVSPYKKANGKWSSTTTRMHRVVLNPKPEEDIDHANRNKLDNQKHNLRVCGQALNNGNRAKCSRPKDSIYKGVSRVKNPRMKKVSWRCQVKVNGKTTNIGSYNSEVEAAKAYNDYAVSRFGDFALLNAIPDEARAA
jgi:hypothetical protein